MRYFVSLSFTQHGNHTAKDKGLALAMEKKKSKKKKHKATFSSNS